MYKGTTPTFIFTFEDFDPTVAEKILVTFSTGNQTLLELDNDDLLINTTSVSVSLTQEQTIHFPNGNIFVQINFKYEDGNRVATDIHTITWNKNLHNQVIK